MFLLHMITFLLITFFSKFAYSPLVKIHTNVHFWNNCTKLASSVKKNRDTFQMTYIFSFVHDTYLLHY